MGTELIKFEILADALMYLENYFKAFPPNIYETEAKIYLDLNKYCLILNKFDWCENE